MKVVIGGKDYDCLNKSGMKLVSELEIFDFKEEIQNPYSGRSCLLEPFAVALYDFIKGCENPERFLFDYFDALMNYYKGDSIKAWISALSLTNVRKVSNDGNSCNFVNGFNENNIKVVDENTSELMFPNLYEDEVKE